LKKVEQKKSALHQQLDDLLERKVPFFPKAEFPKLKTHTLQP
jgi:hypothetical protein